MKKAVALGQWVKDDISGIVGVVDCIKTWRCGQRDIGIKREGVDSNGKTWETVWSEEIDLQVIERDK